MGCTQVAWRRQSQLVLSSARHAIRRRSAARVRTARVLARMLALRGLPPQQALLRRIPELQVFHGYTHSSLLGTRDFHCSQARLYPFMTTLNFLCRCKRPSDPQATLRRLCVWTSSFRRSDHHARSHRYRAPWPRTPSRALLSPTSKAMWSPQSGPQGRSQLEPFPLWPSVPDSLFKPDSILTNSQVSRGQPSIRRTARRIACEDLATLAHKRFESNASRTI